MLRRNLALLALAASTIWVASALAQTDAKSILASASKALAADGLKTLEFSGSGYDFALGQNVNPAAPWPKFNDKTYTRVVSWGREFETLKTYLLKNLLESWNVWDRKVDPVLIALKPP